MIASALRAEPSTLLSRLACPSCHSFLRVDFACAGCDAAYPVQDGIPVLLPPELEPQKLRQRAYFDGAVHVAFEIERPFASPLLYRRLLEEKFARAVRGLGHLLPGASALVVCGGSGMDAHFLARAGARVTTSDLSLGAASRARERGRRFGLSVESVVADAERLPFADRSFDLVYVHDGLHHLDHPKAALAEMARVARVALSVTEPAHALATRMAVRLGLALENEKAGNHVGRFALHEVAGPLRERGFRVVDAHRYAMYYRHEPGRASRLLSSAPLFSVATVGLRGIDVLVGRWGNKLTVKAVRP